MRGLNPAQCRGNVQGSTEPAVKAYEMQAGGGLIVE